MAGIVDAFRSSGFDTSALSSFEVRETSKGIRRTLGVAPHGRAPLLASSIRELVMACPDTLIGIRDRSLILTGFSAALRRSELSAIDLRDLTFVENEPRTTLEQEPGKVLIRIPRSKTDPEWAGRTVVLVPGERDQTCPVRALRAWIAAAGLTGDGALYRAIDRHGNVSRSLAPASISRILKKDAARASLPSENVASHSLRAGLVTQSSLNGDSPLAVMGVTGHRTVAAVKRYCRAEDAIGAASRISSGL